MTDQILTDEEKDALIDGMSNGEVEVQANGGPRYADVREFEIAPRARIVRNSYPRLLVVNQQIASRIGKQLEQMLNAECEVSTGDVDNCTFNEFCDRNEGLVLLTEFSAAPLPGTAFVQMNAAIIGNLVETFFGGSAQESKLASASFFTSGELSVARLFANALLETLVEAWAPLMDIQTEPVATHQGTDVVDSLEAGDAIIVCEFSVEIAGAAAAFSLILPLTTVAPLIPVFEGQKRERDPADDARWEQALRARITDSVINISSMVGRKRMTLGEVAALEPGAIFEIENPQRSRLYAGGVAVLEGRFGVHDGRYAIEANKWLEPAGEGSAA